MISHKVWMPVIMLLLIVSCQQTDPAVTALVKTRLAADGAVNAFEIDVDTKDGVVTLTGNIDDRTAKANALQIARDTEGVKRVVDMISVRVDRDTGDAPGPDRTLGEAVDDAGITAEVKARLLADPAVKGSSIDVDTRDGVVYLTGTVDSADEKDHAIELARETEHVKKVQANITVKSG